MQGSARKKAGLGWRLFIVIALIAAIAILLGNCAAFGGTPGGQLQQRIEASPRYQAGKFANVVAQAPATLAGYWKFAIEQFSGDQLREPPSAIPVVPLSGQFFSRSTGPGLRAVWFGHATVLIELDGVRLMVDPVFSSRVSPINFAGPKRFHPTPVELSDLPKIDAVMISHDHYDHLDMPTIKHLAENGTQFFVPLGVGAHLQRWGVPDHQINDMEWWQEKAVGQVNIVCTPSRHYSGRDLFDYKKTLWSSWAILGPDHRIYYSGDTGFASHFQEIGQRLGPFDLNVIKVGAYGPGASWRDIHMTPEQAVEAHANLGGTRMLPVHWATFNLALHDWDEPIIRTLKAAAGKGFDIVTPRVGEAVVAGQKFNSQSWWEQVNVAGLKVAELK